MSGLSPLAIAQIGEAVGYAAGGGVAPGPTFINIDLQEVEALLRDLIARADQIVEALQNPDATAAEEKLRKAAIAMNRGWFDDAERELHESIALFKYRALPHFLLGLACLNQGRSVNALGHLDDAVKYGAEADKSAAVTAGLLAITLVAAAGAADSVPSRLRSLESFGRNREIDYLLHVNGIEDKTEQLLLYVESKSSASDPVIRSFASAIPGAVSTRRDELEASFNSLRLYGETLRATMNETGGPLPRPEPLVNRRPSVRSEWFRARTTAVERAREVIEGLDGKQGQIRDAAEKLSQSGGVGEGLREGIAYGNTVCSTLREATKGIEAYRFRVDVLADAVAGMTSLIESNGEDPFEGAKRPKFAERREVGRAADLMRSDYLAAVAAATDALKTAQGKRDAWLSLTPPDVVEVFKARSISEPNRPLGDFRWIAHKAIGEASR